MYFIKCTFQMVKRGGYAWRAFFFFFLFFQSKVMLWWIIDFMNILSVFKLKMLMAIRAS